MKTIIKLILCLSVGLLTQCADLPTVGVSKPLLFDGHRTQSDSEEGYGEGDLTAIDPIQKAKEAEKKAKEARAKTNPEYAKVLQARLQYKQRAKQRETTITK